MRNYKWEILNKLKVKNLELKSNELQEILLENRGLKTKKQKEEFLSPKEPQRIVIEELGIGDESVKKAILRITKAIKKNEGIVIYGDYDADGICSTAILWECLYKYTKKVTPHIPDRFSEGYGINIESISKLKTQIPELKLIITVDNGIVAHDAIDFANTSGIDVVITDHHEKEKTLPKAHAIIHSTQTSGAGLAWFFAKEIDNLLKGKDGFNNSLEMAAIGVVADQLPLRGVNRSLVKYGLERLRITPRAGLNSLFTLAGVEKSKIGTYEIGYLIAPRINAMGRLSHGLESLRLLCTKSPAKSIELATLLNDTNTQRQKVVDEVVFHAFKLQQSLKSDNRIIILSDAAYHEGVIGLAASRLVEKFYLPSIVISKGETESKGSARSIAGVSIIEMIRGADEFLIGGGGHTMAAGFSIKNENLENFIDRMNDLAQVAVKDEFLEKKLKIDTILDFRIISNDTLGVISKFEPFGIGNPTPVFSTEKVEVVDLKKIGADQRHLKMKVKKKGFQIEAVGFGMGERYLDIKDKELVQIAYTIEENNWNGNSQIQLKLKDIK